MIQFPHNAIVNIPAGALPDGECLVSVRLDAESKDIPNLKKIYDKRLLNFEIINGSYNDFSMPESLEGMRVRIHIAGSDLSGIGAHVNSLKSIQPLFVVSPDRDAVRKMNFLTAFNFPVRIDTSIPPETEDSLEKALDFYLHNPLLTVPVEPFHTLLQTLSRSQGFNLWDIEMEKVNVNFFISKSGKITLSSRWDDKGLYYGGADDSWDEIINSEAFRTLSFFKKMLFQKQSPCIFCPHFNPCEGFLKAVDPDWPCDAWKKVFSTLRDEVKKAINLLKTRAGE